MPNEHQEALAESAAELSQVHGEAFVFGFVEFTAWPVDNFTEVPGRLESAPESPKLYEAVRFTTPAFERGDALTLEGAAVRCSHVFRTDPTSGRFRFSIS